MHLASEFIGKSKDIVDGPMFDEVVKQRDTIMHELSLLKAVAFKYIKALEAIAGKSMPTTADSGDSGILEIAREALDTKPSITVEEYIKQLEEKLRILKTSAEKSHALIDGCGIVMTRDKTHQSLQSRIGAIIAKYKSRCREAQDLKDELVRVLGILRTASAGLNLQGSTKSNQKLFSELTKPPQEKDDEGHGVGELSGGGS
jgi:hypothetical protein